MTDTTPASLDPTDPETHSIHLTDTRIPLTIEPGDTAVPCHVCYLPYEEGQWRVLVPEVRTRRGQLHMHGECAKAIASAVAHIPTTPAPWVDYS